MSLEPGAEGERFIVMEPGKDELYTDIMACDKKIKPKKIGGTWYPSRPTAKDLEGAIVVIHYHGGGYSLGDGRIQDCGFAASLIEDHTPAKYILCPQYRLAWHEGSRFPAALQDALTSYLYVIHTLNIPPNRVVLSGDSAGAHMIVQFLRYMSEHASLRIPAPKAAWLWSPWCDAATALLDPHAVYRAQHYQTDFLPSHHLPQWMAETYPPRPSTDVTVAHPYITQQGHPFEVVCKVFTMMGGVEVNLGGVVRWHEEMEGVAENDGKLELWIEEFAPHDILKCGKFLGFEKEAAYAVKKAAVFTWSE
jgi:acetyl esterase/lipase